MISILRCILSTYMEYHSSSTYTWTLRLSVGTMFAFMNWLSVIEYVSRMNTDVFGF